MKYAGVRSRRILLRVARSLSGGQRLQHAGGGVLFRLRWLHDAVRVRVTLHQLLRCRVPRSDADVLRRGFLDLRQWLILPPWRCLERLDGVRELATVAIDSADHACQ